MLQVLASSAAAYPDAPLADLTMVQPAEVDQVVGSFNQTERSLPAPFDSCTIHGMFEHWADLTPTAPALTYEVNCWSYLEDWQFWIRPAISVLVPLSEGITGTVPHVRVTGATRRV